MRIYPKEYIYTAGKEARLDADFDAAQAVGKVKPGKTALFFRTGLKWYAVPFDRIARIFRRIDMVYGKLCCGGRTYDVQMLALVLGDGRGLEIHVGDDMSAQAEELYGTIQESQPQLMYGKP